MPSDVDSSYASSQESLKNHSALCPEKKNVQALFQFLLVFFATFFFFLDQAQFQAMLPWQKLTKHIQTLYIYVCFNILLSWSASFI